MSDSDLKPGQEKQAAGEFGHDYDNGNVLYHYGDGFATGSDGKQYMEIDGGHIVDMETGQVHYAPSGNNAGSSTGDPAILWLVAGVICAFLCIVFIRLLFDPETTNFLRYLFDAVITGCGAVHFFSKLKK